MSNWSKALMLGVLLMSLATGVEAAAGDVEYIYVCDDRGCQWVMVYDSGVEI